MFKKIASILAIASTAALLFSIKRKKKEEITSYPLVEKKPFVIIIPTFNDQKAIQQTLFSAYEQQYDNFRVILVDDQSTDRTIQKAAKTAAFARKEDKTTIISHSKHIGILGSIYNAVHTCDDHEIALILLGGDRLATPRTLDILNRAYANPSIWATYGTALSTPSFEREKPQAKAIHEKISLNQLLRKSPWNTPPPFSFYSTLFKEIPIGDLFYRGHFYAMGWEFALGFPLFELAAGHTQAIETPLCLATSESSHRHQAIHPTFYSTCEQEVRGRDAHPPLSHPPTHTHHLREKADVAIFSKNRPLELFALLESIQRYVIGTSQISVFYQSSTQPFETGYLELKRAFPSVQFINWDGALKSQLLNTSFAPSYSSSPYIILATDGSLVTDLINIGRAVDTLESTGAYGIYFDLHRDLNYSSELKRYQPIPITTPLPSASSTSIEAWQFSWATDDWSNQGSLHFTLYRKEDLAPLFAGIDFSSPEELVEKWNLKGEKETVGLFHTQAKAICLERPANLTNNLEKFLGGLKLDLSAFFQLQPRSREIAVENAYIPRE